ncbi:hypothetical protein ACEWPM_001495 [Roseovarius sp. S4756]|uniref:hypothetical protein n=1 Tax=Roseovarius maritimus TaxID=3342637 RepID=UPI00372C33F7
MFTRSAIASALVLLAAPALGQEPMPLTYEQFEIAVAHVDLETCPSALAEEGVFCRATLRHDEIHVFVFRDEGESLLTGFKSYPADGLATLLE